MFDGESSSITPGGKVRGVDFSRITSNNTKSTRLKDTKDRKKYISPRNKKDRSRKSSQHKSKESINRRKIADKQYFDYIKHNESLNFYDHGTNSMIKGLNISTHEADGRNKSTSKPQYGTENMTNVISLLNHKKKNIHSKKTKRNTSNHISMKKLGSVNKSTCKVSH